MDTPSAPPLSVFESKLIETLKRFNSLLHVILALALVAASVMVIIDFSQQVVAAFQSSHMAVGFLHALGILFIVWTLSSLITAEIQFVQTKRFHLRVFLEVAMITLLRSLIIEPIQVVTKTGETGPAFDVVHYGALLAAILIVGVVHRLIGDGASGTEAAKPDGR